MAEKLQQVGAWIKDKVAALSRRAKILWIIGAVLFVLIVVFLILSAVSVDYVVFNRDLTPEQTGRISAKLTELNIEHEVIDNATTVLVNSEKVDEARMNLAMSGFSASEALTYDDVYADIPFTASSETRNKIFLQRKRKSLAASLAVIEPIESAAVELYIKESSTFVNLNEDMSSASIVLTLKKDKELSKQQIDSILSFVVTSVEGLEPEKVTLLDQNGIKLNTDEEVGDVIYDSTSQDELKVTIERRIDKSVTDFLATVYGNGNVKVKSSVKLDFNAEITDIDEFSPSVDGSTEGIVRSINTLKENVINKEAQGAPGTDTNTTETPQYPTGDDSSSGYKKSQEIINYEINNVKKHLEKEQGQISNISVAVIVNKKALVDETLTAEDKTTLIELVKASADDFKKHSNITVMAQEFVEEEVVPLETEEAGLLGIPIWVWIVIAVSVLAVIIITVIMLKKRKKESEEIIEEIQTEQEELEEIRTDFEDKSSPKYQIEKFIDSRPEVVAQLIRSWMNDD